MGRYSIRRSRGTPGLAAAGGVGLALTVVFASLGHFSGESAAPDWSARELAGMAFMLIGLPAYLLAAWTIGQRRSLELVEQMRPRLPDPRVADRATAQIEGAWSGTWWIGTAIGIVLSLFNTQPLWAILESPAPRVSVPISLGQVLLWTVIGNLLATRFAVSNAFAALGESVSADVFGLERLRPLARNGVVDAAIVMGALLFVPLQSLDAEFRWENYRFGLLVALPALAVFLFWPLRTVHRRIRADRDARLRAVDEQIEAAGDAPPEGPEETERLEHLLAHRDRLREARTWPLDLRLLSRVLLYVIIPPLAWAAAALVERGVDAALGGR